MDENNNTPTPEELKEEQESLAEVQDDKLRSDVVASLGLEDNDANKDLIDKALGREKEHRSRLSKAIKQKQTWRTKAQGPVSPKPVTPPEPAKPLDADGIRKQTEDTVSARLNEEYLDESDFSDAVKQDIRDEAKRSGVSYRKAAKSEFVLFKLDKEKQATRANEAANNGSRKGPKTGQAIDTTKPLNPADFDLSTPEGRKDWETAKKAYNDARQK